MSGIDLLIVLVFVSYSATAGLRARKRASKNLDEYYLAGRGLKGWRAGISMAAQRALGRVLLATASCGASLLILLASVTKLILKLPGDSLLMPVLGIVGALLLVPLWWGKLTGEGR